MTHGFSPSQLADQMEASLWRDLIDPWFPRCVDPDGGFHQNFDHAWNAMSPTPCGSVFQARMTWVSAVLSELDHARQGEFTQNASHGIDFLLA